MAFVLAARWGIADAGPSRCLACGAQVWESTPGFGDKPFLDTLWTSIDEVRMQLGRQSAAVQADASTAQLGRLSKAGGMQQGRVHMQYDVVKRMQLRAAGRLQQWYPQLRKLCNETTRSMFAHFMWQQVATFLLARM